MHELTIYVYVSGIGLAVLFLYVALRLVINAAERRRQHRLRRLKDIDAVPTESPLEDSDASFRNRGKERIRARFTITRKLLSSALVLIAAVLIALPFLGELPSTGVSLGIAVVTVLIGIAARPLLENFMAGITISFSDLVRVGDVVDIDDHYGTIEDITMTHTLVRRWDWIRYTVPNAVMVQKPFMNYTICDLHRWVHVEFHVAYDSDMDMVRGIAENAPRESKFFNDAEPPQLWIVEMGKESVKCMVVAWATSPADGWMLSVDMRRRLLRQFQEHGIISHTYRHSPGPQPGAAQN